MAIPRITVGAISVGRPLDKTAPTGGVRGKTPPGTRALAWTAGRGGGGGLLFPRNGGFISVRSRHRKPPTPPTWRRHASCSVNLLGRSEQRKPRRLSSAPSTGDRRTALPSFAQKRQ